MIEFYSENDFQFSNSEVITKWISKVVDSEGFELGDIEYVFCSDAYLLQINQEFLHHDTFTDIVSFDYSLGKLVNGEIYISTDRVAENASSLEQEFDTELHRVMVHGVLHFCGYKDGTEQEKRAMRDREDFWLDSLKTV